jgi:hypothetical protein
VYTNASLFEEHQMSKDEKDTSVIQNEVPWYSHVLLIMFFVREVKVMMILVGIPGLGLGLMLLLQRYHGSRATGKTSRIHSCYSLFRLYV